VIELCVNFEILSNMTASMKFW